MICPKCETENRDSAKFCDYCGFRFDRPHDGVLVQTSSEEGIVLPSRTTLAAILVALAIIVILAFFVSNKAAIPRIGATHTTTKNTTTLTTTVIYNIYNGMNYTADIHYNTNLFLNGNVATTGGIFIAKGVNVITNGYSLIAAGTFNNSGLILAGNPDNQAPEDSAGTSYPLSYGGSGGSGGGGNSGYGGKGSTPQNPQLTNAELLSWFNSGFVYYLTGGAGGGACSQGGVGGAGGSTRAPGGTLSGTSDSLPCAYPEGTDGASGSYGVYIQANRIIAGSIIATGLQAMPSKELDAGGGGGGGVIIFAYGYGGFVPGNYSVSGGAAQQDSGTGGAGQVWIYPYGGFPPINP